MKILLLWPKYPDTFWSFKYALKFIGKRAAFPPLGLLTVAAFLPPEWPKKLIDLNVTELKDEDIKWADYVFISAMVVQKKSVKEVAKRCRKLGKKTVAGGPLFATGYKEFKGLIDYFVLGEAEVTLEPFLKDLKKGCPKKIYQTEIKPDLKRTPIPAWDLVDMGKYASTNIQYSRGCPFNCEFCDITVLFGRKQRFKDKEQIIAELETLYQRGWRGGVFFVDDNFIGNKQKIKEEILPAIIDWMEKRNYPFRFTTEASINLADDEELMKLMSKAGFDTVFVGIETPNKESLAECGKFQNTNRDLLASVRRIQEHGMEVQGGFIVGFDHDTPSIFQRQIDFIQRSGVVTAMVGLLNVLRETRLYHRLKKEGRLLREPTGDNTDFSINFLSKMDRQTLISGYRRIVNTIYSPKFYYQRLKTFLKTYIPSKQRRFHFHFYHLRALFQSIWVLGIREKERLHYWGLIFWSLFTKPRVFPLALTLAIYGYHFRKTFEKPL